MSTVLEYNLIVIVGAHSDHVSLLVLILDPQIVQIVVFILENGFYSVEPVRSLDVEMSIVSIRKVMHAIALEVDLYLLLIYVHVVALFSIFNEIFTDFKSLSQVEEYLRF